MSKKLTQEMISMKVKNDRIQTITHLNLWGSDLDDISILSKMPMLEVVSLSVNKIRFLKSFENMQNLKQLSLRKNLISDFNELKYLATCPNLQILWLNENPISDSPNYRSLVIKYLPSLIKLDDITITDSERDQVNYGGYNNDYNPYQYERKASNKKEYDYENNFNYGRPNNEYNNYYNNKKPLDNEYNNDYYCYENRPREQQMKKRKISNEMIDNNIYNKKVYNDNDYLEKRKYQIKQGINTPEQPLSYHKRNVNNYEIEEHSQQGDYSNRQKENIDTRGSNIMNCMVMLLKELNDNELEYIKDEIDKKIAKY